MTEEKLKTVFDSSEKDWQELKTKSKAYQNCPICNKRLVLTICDEVSVPSYCVRHCPKHRWATDYDWPKQCQLCGINYDDYLETVLEKNNIKFQRFDSHG